MDGVNVIPSKSSFPEKLDAWHKVQKKVGPVAFYEIGCE